MSDRRAGGHGLACPDEHRRRGVGPKLLKKPGLFADFDYKKFGVHEVWDLGRLIPLGGERFYLPTASIDKPLVPPRLRDYEYDATKHTLTPKGYFSQATQDGDRSPYCLDAVTCVFYRGGKPHVSTRPNPDTGWGPAQPIGGISETNAHSPVLFKLLSKEEIHLAYCTPAPNSKVRHRKYDRQTNTAGPVHLEWALPFDRPQADWHQEIRPSIDPDTGEAYGGWWVLGRQGFPNNAQRLHYVLPNGKASVHGVYDPKGNHFDGFAAWGSSLLCPTYVTGANPELTAGINELQFVTTSNVAAKTTGGPADFPIWTPPNPGAPSPFVGLLVFGALAVTPIQTPFAGSPLGLNPSTIFHLQAILVATGTGFGKVRMQLPPLHPNASVDMQVAYMDTLAFALFLGNTSRLYAQN